LYPNFDRIYLYKANKAHALYLPYQSNSILVANRYNAFYLKNGMPKIRGRSYFNPKGKLYLDETFKSKGFHQTKHSEKGKGTNGDFQHSERRGSENQGGGKHPSENKGPERKNNGGGHSGGGQGSHSGGKGGKK